MIRGGSRLLARLKFSTADLAVHHDLLDQKGVWLSLVQDKNTLDQVELSYAVAQLQEKGDFTLLQEVTFFLLRLGLHQTERGVETQFSGDSSNLTGF
jgi:hypothetical protein